MAELADAADSKSAEVHPSWGFNSPSRHHTHPRDQLSFSRYPIHRHIVVSLPQVLRLAFPAAKDEFSRHFGNKLQGSA